MVYTGGRSNGCLLCVKRRIKCDGGRPSCQKCIKYKAACPGYRDQGSFKFVSENYSVRVSSERQKETFGQKLHRRNEISIADDLSSEFTKYSFDVDTIRTRRSSQSLDSLNLPPTLAASNYTVTAAFLLSWEDRSVNLFFRNFTLAENEHGSPGYLNFLPGMYQASEKDSGLKLAVQAASYAAMASRSNISWLEEKARSIYGKALTSVNQLLRKDEEAIKDDTIVAVLLLVVFEQINCDYFHFIGNHDAGLRMLLDMRGDSQLETPRGRAIFRSVMSYIRMRDFNKKSWPSYNVLVRSDKLKLSPSDPSVQSYIALFDANQVCAELTGLLRLDLTDPAVRARMLQLMESSPAFELEHEQWAERLPPIWRHRDVEPLLREALDGTTQVRTPTKPIHVYQDLWFAATTNFYRLGHVILYETVARCARQLEKLDWFITDDAEKRQWRSNLKTSGAVVHRMKADIAASVPYCLGDVDSQGNLTPNVPGVAVGGYFLLWPLMHLHHCDHTAPQHAADAGKALGYIGNVLGIKRALTTPPIASNSKATPSPSVSPFQLMGGSGYSSPSLLNDLTWPP